MTIENDGSLSAAGIIGDASNIRTGSNPLFALSDFSEMYPQFGPDTNGNYLVPETVLQMYIDLANASIMEARWHSYWKTAMGWFVAHFCTLYLLGSADPGSSAGKVLASGQAVGLNTSE